MGAARPAGLTAVPLRRYLAGGLMTLVGLAVVLDARTFGMGTLARVGPGLYPTLIGAALAGVGVLIALVPDDEAEEAALARPDWRGWSCIVAGIVLFMTLGERFGLGPATFGCVFVSALGDRRASWRGAALLALGLTVVAAIVFSAVLKFQLPLWRW